MSATASLATIALALVTVALGACGTSGAGDDEDTGPNTTSCPDDLPASCPTPTPSFATDVAPIVAQRCAVCHSAGGLEVTPVSFTMYSQVYADRGAVLDQIYTCYMPPPNEVGAADLTAAERATMLAWLVCGAPNN